MNLRDRQHHLLHHLDPARAYRPAGYGSKKRHCAFDVLSNARFAAEVNQAARPMVVTRRPPKSDELSSPDTTLRQVHNKRLALVHYLPDTQFALRRT